MITEIRLANFQGWRRLKVKLDERVTTLVGPSDRGKSAVIRALKWIAFNRPRGDAMIRDGAKFVGVSVFVDDHQITRKKGSVNHYSMRPVGEEEGVTYNAFGTQVPDDIAELLNVGEVNFQDQHDPPYWFTLSPGQVSKQLNAIVDLGIIDDTLKNLASQVRTHKEAVAIHTEHVVTAKATVAEFARIPEASGSLAYVETKLSEYETIASQRRSLGRCMEQVSTVASLSKSLKERATGARNCVQTGGIVVERAEQVDQLERLVSKYETAHRGSTAPDFSGVEHNKTQHDQCETRTHDLARLVHKLTQAQARFDQATTSHQATHQIIERECEGVCPLCHNQLS